MGGILLLGLNTPQPSNNGLSGSWALQPLLPGGFRTSGFLPQLQRQVRHRPHAHHTGYNRHDRVANQCGSRLTEDALKHPKRNLVTLNVSWIAWWGMSLLWFSALAALETENKTKIYESLSKSMGTRFVLPIPVEGLGWSSWQHLSPNCIFSQRKERVCMSGKSFWTHALKIQLNIYRVIE